MNKEQQTHDLEKGSNFFEFVNKNKSELTLGVAAIELVAMAILPSSAMASKASSPPKPEISNAEVVSGIVTPPGINEHEQESGNSPALIAGFAAAAASAFTTSLMRRRSNK